MIVPNYNYARYLELRLQTLLGQTLTPDEIILLDDASTDDSLTLVEAIAAHSPVPIRIERSVRNSANPFVQWSRGLELATGDLVWIAEADDYCEPTLLETLAAELADESVVMAWCDSVMVDADGRGSGALYKDYYGRQYGQKWQLHFKADGRELVDDCLLVENVVPNASAVLFRRHAVRFDLEAIRNYRFSGDWWFWLSMALQGRVAYRADPLNYHRRHAHSVMGDVLRSSDRLIPETVAFYERVALAHPGLIDGPMLHRILTRVDQILGQLPMADGASAQAELAACRQRLADMAVGLRAASADSGFVVCLAGAVVQPDSPSLDAGIVALCRQRGARVLVLSPPAQAAAFATKLGVEPACVVAIDPALTTTPAREQLGRVVMPEPLMRALDALGEGGASRRVYSHGFGAHALGAALQLAQPAVQWVALAGAEFDGLLGNGGPERARMLDEARSLVEKATEAWFVGNRPSHAYARLCQTARRRVDRWQPPGGGEAAASAAPLAA
ncbi:MAG: glycosyltransferase, partial [bacterium]